VTLEQKTTLASAISVDKDVLHGTPCFAGSRVPVQTLIDFLETGESIDQFLAVYPHIARDQVLTFLDLSKEITLEQMSCVSS
jgi:uncharacterized protein (DUF433 family)